MSPSIQLKQTMNGGASPRRNVYKDASVAKIPFIPTFLKALETGVVKPTFPESGAVSEALVKRLSEILNKKISVSEGLDQAASDLERILGKKAIRKY
jgi:ABC-type glycerol-3-phosphate transport system substrate-binding protein